MDEDFHRPRSSPRLVHLQRRQRRVLVDPLDLIAQVAERVVLQVIVQAPCRTIDRNRLVDVAASPSCKAPIVEPRLIVGIEIRGANPASKVIGDARPAIAVDRRVAGHDVSNLVRERRRNALVRIEREDPVVGRGPGSEVLLIDVAAPFTRQHAGACRPRDIHRSVGTA